MKLVSGIVGALLACFLPSIGHPQATGTKRSRRQCNWTPDLEPTDPEQNGPSNFTAFQEQLGLKLESAKEPIDTIVVDRIEKPSED